MYAKIAILLLGFAAAAYAQCSCSGVKECVEGNKPQIPQAHTDCITKCKSKLPATAPNANPDVLTCIEHNHKTVKGAERNCILQANGVACTRKRRQTGVIGVDGQAQAQTNTQAQAAGQQIGAQTNLNVAASASADFEVLLHPYFQCVRECVPGASGVAGAAEGVLGQTLQDHLNSILNCTASAGCSKITQESLQSAVQTCKTDTTFAIVKSQAKHDLCICIQKATGQSNLACGSN